jgi:aldehyde dehydrogenase (NAD+)
MNCGQICVAPDYVLVHRSRAQEFTTKMKEAVSKAFGENPKESPDYGAIVNQRHTERIKGLIETSKGEVLCGGAAGVDVEKRYVPPTIIMGPALDAPIMQEEIFGPVLPVLVFDHLDDALAIVNSKETPLALYVFTQSSQNAEKVLSTATSGGACVNTCMEHIISSKLPFGGKGPSGMGAYHGKYGFEEFSHSRAVLYKTTMPGRRGAFVPLPDAEKPAPSWVYDIAVRVMVKGVFRRRLARCFRAQPEVQPLE